ncbi:hypothetical protein ACFFQW_20175 [Umezawaea endophytica]|uniref:Nucleotidyltransferase-like protein n=1 Tax=Umezawaea endophytica TaxID=1654476 RepID=A0A9X3A5K9_9PSEU|nr:hypothetical protein [Umezawaea endophytica]MCS7482368.1 hypothetical protein [Umezawaea endophytica]
MDALLEQDALQAESDAVVDALGLNQSLAVVGEPVRVGSSALGLLVKRDIDITVVCQELGKSVHEAVANLGAELARHHRVERVLFRNDTGSWNTDATYPDGFYLGATYRSAAGDDWNLDIWFVDEPERQPDLDHVRSMPARLTPEIRAAILEIKKAYLGRPEHGKSVNGYEIYRAVLDDGVRTPEAFELNRVKDPLNADGRTTPTPS